MRDLQIILICMLVGLGLAFFIVLYMRINESIRVGSIVRKKKVKEVEAVLSKNMSTDDMWNSIWPIFYKNGEIQFSKIDSTITYILNHNHDANLHKKAIKILELRIPVTVFGEDTITDAISKFSDTLKQCGNQEYVYAGFELIRYVQDFCKRNSSDKKYDIIIQWIFNAIEIIGLILAIITL